MGPAGPGQVVRPAATVTVGAAAGDRLQPLSALVPHVGAVRAILVDIDDTLSTEGRITARAYAALER
jgi:hypothetical protein